MKQQQFENPISLLQILEIKNQTHNFSPPLADPTQLKAYLQFFGIQNQSKIQELSGSMLQQLPSDIEYNEEYVFEKSPIVKITKHTSNYEMIDVEVFLGYFHFKKITIVTMQKSSPTHRIYNSNSGNFGNVYRCECQGVELAFKCFAKIDQRQQKNVNILERVVQEYCLLKLASVFEVGPKMFDVLGYDIIVYPECIQIAMESCKFFPISYIDIIELIDSQLKEDLLRLHSLKITHHDIKIQNICFSTTFNKFVFIDYGMGRILREDIGFKSLTSFRGTIDHVSDQMAELYRQSYSTKKAVDLYFNDIFGLRETLKQLRKEEYQSDIILINEQRQLKETYHRVNLSGFFFISFIKYNIFQMKQISFNLVKPMIKRPQLRELINFIFKVKQSPKLKENYLQLLVFAREQSYLNYLQGSQQLSLAIQSYAFYKLNQMNKKSLTVYFSHPQNYSQLIDTLKNTEEILKMSLEDYFFLLSKAIQINANQLTLKELNQLCKGAFQRSQQVFLLQKELVRCSNQQLRYLFKVSEFLFKRAVQKQMKGKYSQIYQCIIENVFCLQIFTNEELSNYYSSILRINANFNEKLKILVRFHSSLLMWKYFNSFDLQNFLILKEKIDKLSKQYLCTFPHNYDETQIKLLNKIIIDQSETKNNLHEYPHLQSEIKVWLICNKIKRAKLMERDLILQEYECEKSFTKSAIFEFYHFYLMIAYIQKRKHNQLGMLINKYAKSLKYGENTPFLMLSKMIYTLQKDNYGDLQTFVDSLRFFQHCEHPIINYLIQIQLRKMSMCYYTQFNQLPFTHKTYCYNLRLSLLQKLNIQSQPTNQLQYFEIVKTTFSQILISKKYQQQMYCHLQNRNKMQVQNLQSYRRLKNNIDKGQQNKNVLRFYTILFIAILLIQKNQYKNALSLSKYLSRLLSFIPNKIMMKKQMLEFIFSDIIGKSKDDLKNQNRQIYFQYARIIALQQMQDVYLRSIPFFIDIVQLYYKFKPQQLPIIISKTSKRLQKYNYKNYALNYIQCFQYLFLRNTTNAQFHLRNNSLVLELQQKDNPFNIVPIYFIRIYNRHECVTNKFFIRVFSSLNKINIYARQFILRRLYYIFYLLREKNLKQRKKMNLCRLVVRYITCKVKDTQLFKLLINAQSKDKLSKHCNKPKQLFIHQVLKKYNRYLIEEQKNQFRYNSKRYINYGQIKIIDTI